MKQNTALSKHTPISGQLNLVARFLFLLCFVHSLPCAQAQRHTRILNGTPASEPTPWMVSLSTTENGPVLGHLCGGTLIDQHRVVTAAHCVADYVDKPDQITIAVGRQRLTDKGGRLVGVDGIIVHPEFDAVRITNDIAILRLTEPVVLDRYPELELEELPDETPSLLYGWGVIYADIPVRPDKLQVAQIPVIDGQRCLDALGVDFDPSTMMCAGKLASVASASDGVDSCSGDSGGPLLVSRESGIELAGIVSWGFDCGSDKVWGVYTKISRYVSWIRSVPAVKPFPRGRVRVGGMPVPGGSLRCAVGSWAGDGPQRTEIEWIDTVNGRRRAGNTPRLKIRTSDVGRSFTCVAHVTGPGGQTDVAAEEVVTILPGTVHRGRSTARNSRALTSPARAQSCKGQSCSVLMEFPTAIVRASAVFRDPRGNAKSAQVRQISASAVLLPCGKGAGRTLYLQAALEDGSGGLTILHCGIASRDRPI